MEITKKHNHDHFWVEDGILYESYNTIRGMRFMPKLAVKDCQNIEKCSEEDIENIIKQNKVHEK